MIVIIVVILIMDNSTTSIKNHHSTDSASSNNRKSINSNNIHPQPRVRKWRWPRGQELRLTNGLAESCKLFEGMQL